MKACGRVMKKMRSMICPFWTFIFLGDFGFAYFRYNCIGMALHFMEYGILYQSFTRDMRKRE